MSKIERHPIVMPAQDIKLVTTPLSISDMYPNYRYEFQSGDISDESSVMYENFLDFININEELVLTEPYVNRDDYVKGFQKALALARLWFDSIYLNADTKEG